MEQYTVVISLLAIAISLSAVAAKIKIPYPVLLLVAGIGVGFIPGFRQILVAPDVVFLIFLPPMLYDAANSISIRSFKLNIPTISLLAGFLIFITTTGIAVVVHYCIPDMSWATAFVLGSVLSPPDAIAATGVTRGLGLSHKAETILEGESLVNDASALVAYRFAVAAVAGVSFVPWKAGLQFVIALAGGFLIGYITAHLFIFIVKKLRLNDMITISLNLLLPFVTYLLAEECHVSGVIAVVTCGLAVAGHRKFIFSEHAKNQSHAVWETSLFLLGGLIFILIGLAFPHVLENIPKESMGQLIGVSFIIFLIALIIRVIIVFWHRIGLQKRVTAIKKKINSMDEQEVAAIRIRHRLFFRHRHKTEMPYTNRLDNYEVLTWKECIIISWSGMRGIVSLAAALALPLTMTDGSAFPQRDIIIFLTVVVVVIMLLVQGLGLPLLVKWLKIS